MTRIVANPARHVVISPLPLNAASVIPNLSQPLGEAINVGSAGERQNCLDVGDTVESIEGSREHFGCVGRSDQRIWLIRMPKEVAGENLDSAAGGPILLRLR